MPRVCQRCGQCCEKFWFTYSNKEVLDRLEDAVRRGHNGDIIEGTKHLVMVQRTRKKERGSWIASCKLYDKKKGCLIEKHKPVMCKNYPYGGKGSHPGCGYKGKRKKKEGKL